MCRVLQPVLLQTLPPSHEEHSRCKLTCTVEWKASFHDRSVLAGLEDGNKKGHK